MKTLIAVALIVLPVFGFAQRSGGTPDRPVDEPLSDLQRREDEAARRRAEAHKDARESEDALPDRLDRLDPMRTFPGDLPIRSQTSGTLDRSGRVIQDNRTNAAPTTAVPRDLNAD